MGFALQISQDLIEAEAGATSPITITVTNHGDAVDRFEMEIEGIDAEWKAIPVPIFTAEPHESHLERVFVKPPRTSESQAGNYPFVLKVRSLESGELRTVQGILQLKPFHHLTTEIDPKRGTYSPTAHHNLFDITIVNLGNTEHTLQFTGNDPEDDCTYEFQHDRLVLAPGQQREMTMTVEPKSHPMLSSGKLIGFTIAGRSTDNPSVLTTAQAQLEQRSMLSPTSLFALIVLALLFGAWYLMRPKTPTIAMEINPMRVQQGGSVTISWQGKDGNHVQIVATGPDAKSETVYDGTDMNSSTTYTLKQSGIETFEAEVSKDTRRGEVDRKTLTVDPPPQLVTPVIDYFKASSKKVKLGDSVTFTFRTHDAVQVAIAPLPSKVLPDLESYLVTPGQVGKQPYTLVATSKDGISVRKGPITIDVYAESDAKILSLVAQPLAVQQGGTTTITWQVTNADRVELKQGADGTSVPVGTEGSQSFPINGYTKFILTAWDSKGVTTTKTVTVNIAKPPPPPINTGTTDSTGTEGITPSTSGDGNGTPQPNPPTTGGTTATNGR